MEGAEGWHASRKRGEVEGKIALRMKRGRDVMHWFYVVNSLCPCANMILIKHKIHGAHDGGVPSTELKDELQDWRGASAASITGGVPRLQIVCRQRI
jgi:hypothetical protein